MTTPVNNLARWTVGSIQRLEPAPNNHGDRPWRGIGFDEVVADEDMRSVQRDEGRADLSNALPVFIGRTGPFARLRPTQYRKNPDGTYWLDPKSGKPQVLREDGERHVSTTVLVDGKRVVRQDYARHLRERREAQPQWHMQPACRSMCDEAIGLGLVDECVPGIHSDLLLFFIAEDMRRLPRLYRYGLAYVRRAHREYPRAMCEAAIADALIALYWPDANRGGRCRALSTAGMRNRTTRQAPPSLRTRAREFAMSEEKYAALREFAISMYVGYYNEALRIWAEVSNTHVRDKEYMGGPKTREHQHRRRPVRGTPQRLTLPATDAKRHPKRWPSFGTS